MDKKTLQCVDLTYTLGNRVLFNRLSFEAQAGDLVWLRGSNGAGKSTLLRLIAGILRPDAGSIRWPDAPHETAYIGHRPALNASLTVYETLRFWTRIYDNESLLDAAIHYFALEPFVELRTSQLSAGWRQKLSLCRLIIQPSGLWLLDEPASHLDEDSAGLLQALIASRKEQGGLVILAMHGNADSEDIKQVNLDSYN